MAFTLENDTVASSHDAMHGISGVDRALDPDAAWLHSRLGCEVGASHRVVRHLASGGMGHVFLAEHVRLGTYAAVKLPQPSHEAACNMIEHEAKLLSQLQHPNIVSVLDTGRLADGLPYMLMEYVSGLDLDAWLDGCGAMSAKRSLGILEQVASALDYLHAHDVVHRDIKPANIIFDPRAHDFVKLFDFGIAYRSPNPAVRLGLMGTPAYMAPEQARNEACGPAVDIYGIAALALEMLTGRPPHDCATPQAALNAVLNQLPATPSSRGLCVVGLDAVFARGLHSEPAQRFALASDFVDALRDVFRGAKWQASALDGSADKGVGDSVGQSMRLWRMTAPWAITIKSGVIGAPCEAAIPAGWADAVAMQRLRPRVQHVH